MEKYPGIEFISRKDIDTKKWDACIDNAPNGLIYAYSYYLDAMSTHWSGLISGDYDNVMPLTWNKKWGIHYLYQPFLCAQLGVFGKNTNPEMLRRFILAIPPQFRYIDIYLNPFNICDEGTRGYYLRSNYVLSLTGEYEHFFSTYRENTRRNIKKSEQVNCYLKKDFSADAVIAIAKEQMNRTLKAKAEDYDNLKKIYHHLHRQNQAITYGIFSASNRLLASAIFFFSHQRAYYILAGNHPDGRTTGASHALIDAFIKDHAGKNLILDFEGSDIRSLAFFYSSFGAMEEKYPALRINNLPFYIKWLKK